MPACRSMTTVRCASLHRFDESFSRSACGAAGMASSLRPVASSVHGPGRDHRAGDQRRTGDAQLHRPVCVRPAGVNERLIEQAGFRLIRQEDVTANAALVSGRWHEARQRHKDELLPVEGERTLRGLQQFFAAVHRLTGERRLSRIAYLVEKPAGLTRGSDRGLVVAGTRRRPGPLTIPFASAPPNQFC